MATTTVSNLQMAMSKPCIPSSKRFANADVTVFNGKVKVRSWDRLASVSHVAPMQPFQKGFASHSKRIDKFVTKAMSESSEKNPVSGLPIDLKGYTFFFS